MMSSALPWISGSDKLRHEFEHSKRFSESTALKFISVVINKKEMLKVFLLGPMPKSKQFFSVQLAQSEVYCHFQELIFTLCTPKFTFFHLFRSLKKLLWE